MKKRLLQYVFAVAATGLVICLVRNKIINHKKVKNGKSNVEELSYQQNPQAENYFGEYTL